MAKNISKEELQNLEKQYKEELGPEHICYIYKITNLVNDKKYIGLTTISVESRWRWHIIDSKKKSNKRPLYSAMRKYGIEKFTIECIEECFLKEVQSRERYWIKYYNTFLDKSKGYNCTIGGELGLITKEDEEMIIKAYKKFKTLQKVADELNVDPHRAKRILVKNGIEVKSAVEHQKEKGNTILQYDLNGNLINTFRSRTEVGQWLIDNELTTSKDPNNAGCLLRSTLANDKKEYKGYLWEYQDEYPEELKNNFIKREKNRRTYTSCPICNQNKDPKSIICKNCRKLENLKRKEEKNDLYNNLRKDKDEVSKKIEILKEAKFVKKQIIKKDNCPICGKEKMEKSKYCINCSNYERYLDSVNTLSNKISRIELKNLIRTKSFTEIGKSHNVNDNTIRKWCKKYNLPYRKFDIDKYTDEEWELEIWNNSTQTTEKGGQADE